MKELRKIAASQRTENRGEQGNGKSGIVCDLGPGIRRFQHRIKSTLKERPIKKEDSVERCSRVRIGKMGN